MAIQILRKNLILDITIYHYQNLNFKVQNSSLLLLTQIVKIPMKKIALKTWSKEWMI